MFERYTDRARRVVVLAQEEARMLKHNFIGSEHLLLGMIHEGEGVAAQALTSLGISLEAVRAQVETIIGIGQEAPNGHIPFTPRGKRVLELSLTESLQLGHNYIGTEHLLLGLIRAGERDKAPAGEYGGQEVQGVGAKILVVLGADLKTVRLRVIQILSGYCQPKADEPEQPLGEIPDSLPSIARAFRSIDSVADELRSLKVSNAELQAENEQLQQIRQAWRDIKDRFDQTVGQRDSVRAELDNLFPMLRAAEDQNGRYVRELELLAGAQTRLDELDGELAAARTPGRSRHHPLLFAGRLVAQIETFIASVRSPL